MSKTIWKFEIQPETIIQLPDGAKVLSVSVQNGDVFLWAMVDPNASTSGRRINVYGTGHRMPDDPGTFIGTVMMHGGSFVFHVFDAGPA